MHCFFCFYKPLDFGESPQIGSDIGESPENDNVIIIRVDDKSPQLVFTPSALDQLNNLQHPEEHGVGCSQGCLGQLLKIVLPPD